MCLCMNATNLQIICKVSMYTSCMMPKEGKNLCFGAYSVITSKKVITGILEFDGSTVRYTYVSIDQKNP